MPSGRLGRCIIPGRTGVELYVNSSGKEASVTIQTQVISTTANVEQTIVVGVAATTLSATTTVATSPVGTFTSMRGLHYSCWQTGAPSEGIDIVGVSTINGAFRTPICCIDDGNNIIHGTYTDRGSGGLRFVDPNSGNQTFASHNVCLCGACTVPGGYPWRCCHRGEYGGNEIQNPLIWLMQENNDDHPGGKYGFPNSCSCCTWFWGPEVIGWNPGNNLPGHGMCCIENIQCMPGAQDQFLRAPQVIGCTNPASDCRGVGVFKTDLAITAMQMYIQPCCCCGYTAANTWPVARFDASGCTNNASCCGGPPCNYAACKWRYYYCCHDSNNCCTKILGFNWYTLCRNGRCCLRCTGQITEGWLNTQCSDSNGGITTPGANYTLSAGGTLDTCYPCHKCGTLISPQLIGLRWCGNCWCCNCGIVRLGHVRTCSYQGSNECGVYRLVWDADWGSCSCHCAGGGCDLWEVFEYKYKCPCQCFHNRSYQGRGGGSNHNYIMSPYGFDHGTTNCLFVHHRCNHSNGRHTYFFGWPNFQVSGGGYRYRCGCNCVGSRSLFIYICEAADKTQYNEFPIKYLAWNPFDCYVYFASRSSEPNACGIFRVDADKLRKYGGPHCGCDGNAAYCCGCTWGSTSIWLCDSVTDPIQFTQNSLDFCKIADWPACWANSAYSKQSFCVSCLFRSERCRWLMDIFNHTTGKWDSYSTGNLKCWSMVQDSMGTDPFKLKVSNNLTIESTADFACIVTSCNCFMSNMDCTGLIDYRITANQYERNGIVLSNGDRVMIQNESDEKLNAQIWGYEG